MQRFFVNRYLREVQNASHTKSAVVELAYFFVSERSREIYRTTDFEFRSFSTNVTQSSFCQIEGFFHMDAESTIFSESFHAAVEGQR